jgi:anti-anti-sigma factor
MEIKTELHGDQVNFTLIGVVDEFGAEELKKEFTRVDVNKIKKAVVNFSGVTEFGSAGIGKLLLFYKTLKLNNASLHLTQVPGNVYETFRITELDSLFSIEKS